MTGKDKGWPAEEVAEQVKLTWKQEGATGNVHFSMKALLNNTGGVADALKSVYAEPALVPASPWLGKERPERPRLAWREGTLEIVPGKDLPRWYVVRAQVDGKWALLTRGASGEKVAIPFKPVPDRVMVTAVDRFGTESEPANLEK